jgi:ribonuclease D
MQHDKPRGWILPDAALWSLAERLPEDSEALAKIHDLPPGTLRKRGNELLEIMQRARATAVGNAPPTLFKPDPQQLELVKRLMIHVKQEAERLNISPELLATRRDLEQLAWSGKAGGLSSGWRRDVIGNSLVSLAESGSGRSD